VPKNRVKTQAMGGRAPSEPPLWYRSKKKKGEEKREGLEEFLATPSYRFDRSKGFLCWGKREKLGSGEKPTAELDALGKYKGNGGSMG